MKQKGFVLIPIVIIASFIILTGYIIYSNKMKVKNDNNINYQPTYTSKTQIPTVTITPTLKTTNDKWQNFDNQCISFQYLSSWKYGPDNNVDNSVGSGINWTEIFNDKYTNQEIAKVTLSTNGKNFNFLDYKSKYFNNGIFEEINNKKVYYNNYKYLIETNCSDYYLLIDITDKKSVNTFEDIIKNIK